MSPNLYTLRHFLSKLNKILGTMAVMNESSGICNISLMLDSWAEQADAHCQGEVPNRWPLIDALFQKI